MEITLKIENELILENIVNNFYIALLYYNDENDDYNILIIDKLREKVCYYRCIDNLNYNSEKYAKKHFLQLCKDRNINI